MSVLTRVLKFRGILAVLVLVLPSTVLAQHYTEKILVSSIPGETIPTDPDLKNAWGLTRSPSSPWWVSNNKTGVSTLYNGAGVKNPLVVTIPVPTGPGPSAPTGVVFNGTSDFQLLNGMPARFIFVTE